MDKKYLKEAAWHKRYSHADPIAEIPHVFDQFSHDELRIFIFRFIDAAYRYDIWNDGPFSTFFKYLETLEYGIALIHPVYLDLLDKSKPVPSCFQPLEGRPLERATAFLWKPVPRMLSIHDLKDPTRFIKQFFKFAGLDQWKHLLKERGKYALDVSDGRDSLIAVDSLVLYNYLSKLVDLLFLVDYQIGRDKGRIISKTAKQAGAKN